MASGRHGILARVAGIFHGGDGPHPGNLARDRHYVSDYERFMAEFLEAHPEELAEQKKGWFIWWDKHINLDEQAREMASTVSDSGYGFYPSAWRRDRPH